MPSKKNLLILLFFGLINTIIGQNIENIILFTRYDSISVFRQNNTPYKYPWTGGLNLPQFSEIDVNFDNKKDLFVFDKSNYHIHIFQNTASTTNSVSYSYQHHYSPLFPNLQDWAILKDYNNDGKEDIFASTSAGIKVYKNTSTNNQLSFQNISTLLYAHQNNNSFNIYVSSSDIPGITDIDNDNDLDIFSFNILGAYLMEYQNLSNEKFNNSDSLFYDIGNFCWGDFAEGYTATDIKLNIDCPFSSNKTTPTTKSFHSGSTINLFDLNNDSYKDLLLGDVDNRKIIALYTNKIGNDAIVYRFDTTFPKSYPINISAMPATFFVDINNDRLVDLIAAPTDYRISDNYQGTWAYINKTLSSTENFSLYEKGFLQNDMIDMGQNSTPLFYDYDKDGLTDIISSSYGKFINSKDTLGIIQTIYSASISYFKNIGTKTNPQFQLIEPDLAALLKLNLKSLSPTFADFNNDKIDELIIGQQNGQLLLLQNKSNIPNKPNYQIISTHYSDIDVGNKSTPTCFDLNKDGLLDIICGSEDGLLYYFENIGSYDSAIFSNSPTISKLGNINVIDSSLSYDGNSHPAFFQINDKTFLTVGSLKGNIHIFQVNQNIHEPFQCLSNNFLDIGNQSYGNSTTSMTDLNSDGYPEMLIGNTGGGLLFFKGIKPHPLLIYPTSETPYKIYPNPTSSSFEINCKTPISSVEIHNTQGQLMAIYPQQKNYTISQLQTGLYFIKINLSNHTCIYTKLIKK